jgi:lambda family phage portal protein
VSKPQPGGISQGFENLVSDYRMSRESRFVRRRSGLPANGDSADWHYRTEAHYYRDIEKARDMDRNDAIVGQTVDRAVANIVQDGFTIDPKTGSKSVDSELAARWNAWACDPEACDIAGEFCFHDFESHSCRAMLADGDCVNFGVDELGCLQHLEAHNIRTTTTRDNTFLGVTKDSYGRRQKYWVVADSIQPNRGEPKVDKSLSVRNEKGQRVLFHVYNPRRMSQTRGVTSFAPIFELAGMFEDIQFAKVVQQQVTSCFAVFRSREWIPDLPGNGEAPSYGDASTETTDSGQRQIENIAPGMEIIGEPGEKLEGFSPNVPNAEYFMHVKLMLQMIGVNLGLPLCLVLMDGSETNFSGWRGAVDEARKGFRANQRNLVERFHAPLYRWKVQQWIAEDAALREESKKRNLFSHEWNRPAWQYIEPLKEAQADALRLQNQLISPRRLFAGLGYEWEKIAKESIEDNAMAITAAKKQAAKINKANPDDAPLHWRELVNLPMPNGVQMTMQDPNMFDDSTSDNEAGDE